MQSIIDHPRLRHWQAIVWLLAASIAIGAEPPSSLISAGNSVDLKTVWKAVGTAPKSELATIELLIRPDAACLARPRAFLITLSDKGGRDTAGVSLTLNQGCIYASVLGVKLTTEDKLPDDRWTHVALTVNTKTINKQARLWVNGRLADDHLVLEPWPDSFLVAKMLSDHWSQGRVYSGQLGDVRISRVVRYDHPFPAAIQLIMDDQTVVHLPGAKIPLD